MIDLPGSRFSAEEVEWLKAVDQLRRSLVTRSRPVVFLTAVDFLRLALAMGYRRSPAPARRKTNPAAAI